MYCQQLVLHFAMMAFWGSANCTTCYGGETGNRPTGQWTTAEEATDDMTNPGCAVNMHAVLASTFRVPARVSQ